MPLYPVTIEQGKQDWPIQIDQEATFFMAFQYTDSDDLPVPLTNYTAEMQIRRTVDAEDPPLLTLTVANGGLELDEATGLVMVRITSVQSAALPELPESSPGVYDLLLTAPGANGAVEKLVSGTVQVRKTVTR